LTGQVWQPSQSRNNRRAYVITAVHRHHWLECYRLAFNLRDVGSKMEILCGTIEPPSALTPIDIEVAKRINMTFVHFEPFWSPTNVMHNWFYRKVNWIKAWEKLNLLKMYDYEALLSMDTDTIAVRAPDELLYTVHEEMPFAFTFGMDNCEWPYDPNTGVMALHPRPDILAAFMDWINEPCANRTRPPTECAQIFSSADQSALGAFTRQPDIINSVLGGRKPLALSHIYNMVSVYCDCEKFKPAMKDIAVWHFTIDKPWNVPVDDKNVHPECIRPGLAVYWDHRKRVQDIARELLPLYENKATAVLDYP